MKYRTQALMALILLCVGACAFGQDLRTVKGLGELAPIPSWDGGDDKSVVLVYKKLGVMFCVHKGGVGILYASVFAPASSQSISSDSRGADDLIPGAGARGVMLGASRDQVKHSPFALGAELVADQADGVMYRDDQSGSLMIRFAGGRVSQLDVMGRLRTPEGVTDRSEVSDIERVYGPADQYYEVVNERNPLILLIILPIMLVCGLVFGLATGLVIRGKMQDDAGSAALIRAGAITAVALAISSFLFGFVFLHAIGMPIDWKMMPINMVSAGLTGAICTLVMKSLWRRLSGSLGVLVTVFSMALVSQVVALLTTGTGPVTFDASSIMVPSPNTLFVIGMFLTGRPKTGG